MPAVNARPLAVAVSVFTAADPSARTSPEYPRNSPERPRDITQQAIELPVQMRVRPLSDGNNHHSTLLRRTSAVVCSRAAACDSHRPRIISLR